MLYGGLGLICCDSLNAQCMDPAGHKVCKCLINRAMSDYLRFSAKLRANDNQGEMPAARATGMACVHCTIVSDINYCGF